MNKDTGLRLLPHRDTRSALVRGFVNIGVTPLLSVKRVPRRTRHRMTDEQNTHPTRAEKEVLAEELAMDFKTVNVWFQNRRQTTKRTVDVGKPTNADVGSSQTPESYDTSTSSTASGDDKATLIHPEPSLSITNAANALEKTSSDIPTTSTCLPTVTRIGALQSNISNTLDSAPRVLSLSGIKVSGSMISHTSGPLQPMRAQPTEPSDLWKFMSSSPLLQSDYTVEETTEVDHGSIPEDRFPRDASKDSNKRSLATLEWACDRSAKRTRLERDIDMISGVEPTSKTSHPSSWSSAVTSTFLASRTPEFYPLLTPDLLHGASLLINFKHSNLP